MKTGLYIHIPFCISKCAYCDFPSFAGRESLYEQYVDCVIEEIKSHERIAVDTIFIGGGTPPVVGAGNLCRVLEAAFRRFDVESNAEVSVEMNPASIGESGLRELSQSGVNRISIGMQSAIDSELAILGRVHTFADTLRLYESATRYFSNINLDIMSALPNSTTISAEYSLCKAIELYPTHISCYSLQIEKGTRFDNSAIIDSLPSEDAEREIYWQTAETLANAGYTHYEISNFSKPGFECKHNLKYWQAAPYLGIGAYAHSYKGGRRSVNHALDEYLRGNTVAESTTQSPSDEITDYIIFGLRKISGISKSAFAQRFGFDINEKYADNIRKHTAANLLTADSDSIRLTPKGIDLSNTVFVDFL